MLELDSLHRLNEYRLVPYNARAGNFSAKLFICGEEPVSSFAQGVSCRLILWSNGPDGAASNHKAAVKAILKDPSQLELRTPVSH